jgi:hypothetical protein
VIGSKVRVTDDHINSNLRILVIAMMGRLDIDDLHARLVGLESSLATLRRESDEQKEELDELLSIYESSVSQLSLNISNLPVLC